MSGAKRLILADIATGGTSYEEGFSQEHMREEKGTAKEERAEGERPFKKD